jgi:hypothetical protein
MALTMCINLIYLTLPCELNLSNLTIFNKDGNHKPFNMVISERFLWLTLLLHSSVSLLRRVQLFKGNFYAMKCFLLAEETMFQFNLEKRIFYLL